MIQKHSKYKYTF